MRTSIGVIAICLIVSGCRRTENGASTFSVPDGVTHESKTSPEWHAFHWGDSEETALFMISPHPAGLSESMVHGMAAQTAKLLEPDLKALEEVESVVKICSDISVGRFSGRQVDFLVTTKDGKALHQCIYILWDGERVWQGGLTGPKDSDIAMVHRILRSRAN